MSRDGKRRTNAKGRLKEKAPLSRIRRRRDLWLVLVVEIVIAVVPTTVGVPAVRVFIPPAVFVFIAISAGFREFVPPVFGLRTFDAVVLDGFMKFVVRLDDALLAIVVRADDQRADEKESR
jgi:hypothetical protein